MRKKILSILSIISLVFIIMLSSCTKGHNNTKDNETTTVEHVHTYSNVYSSNDEGHWYQATCEHNLKKDYSTHTYSNWTITKEATEISSGERVRTCIVCGYSQSETISKLEHVHEFSTEYEYNESTHWHSSTCGHNVKSGEEVHNFNDWIVVTYPTLSNEGIKSRTCKVCNYSESSSISKLESHTIIWKDWDGTILETDTFVEAETTPTYDGPTPTKKDDNTYTYTFVGWTPTVSKVSEDTVYTATYTANYIDYTITFVNDDNTILSTNTYHYGDKVVVPVTPTKEFDELGTYEFIGWNKEITKVTSNDIYIATYKLNYTYLLNVICNDGTSKTLRLHENDNLLENINITRDCYIIGGLYQDEKLTNEITLMPASDTTIYVWWKEEAKACDFEYSVEDGKVTISKYLGSNAILVVPEYIGNNPVVEFKPNKWYLGKVVFSSVKSITIPSHVEKISSYTSDGLIVEIINKSSLNIIKGKEDNGEIAYNAINVKTEGTSDIVEVNDYLFYTLDHVNFLIGYVGKDYQMVLPENYNDESYEIYKYSFRYIESLISISIPKKVTKIGDYAFWGCNSLVEVINKSSLYITKGSTKNGYVGYYALNIKLEGPSDIVNINNYLFYTYDNVNYLIKYFGNNTEIVLPDLNNGETYEIYKYTFYNCSNLTSISIPKSVTSIGSSAFYNCSGLTTVYYGGTIIDWLNINFEGDYSRPNNNLYYERNFKYFYMLDSNGTVEYNGGKYSLLTEVIIPEGITSIDSYAFSNFTSLTSITIPNSIISIGSNAFYNCNNLKYNEYDNGYYLGNDVNPYVILVKAKSQDITSCEINEKCNIIFDGAFSGCTNLTNIVIPDSVISISSDAFYSCTNLEYNEYDNAYYLGNDINPYIILMRKKSNDITSCTIHEKCKFINNYAFLNCQNLICIAIPASVTSISSSAFFNCYSLTTLYYDGTIRDWLNINLDGEYSRPNNNYTFKYFYILDENGTVEYNGKKYSLLTDLILPEGITSIDSYAFSNFTSLTSLELPASVTSIGDYAFRNDNLTTLYYDGTIRDWLNINLDREYFRPNNNNEFKYFYILDENGTVEYNGKKYSLLTDLILPEGITSIDSYAFSNFTNLTSLELPASVTSIGNYAFYECENLTTLYYDGTIRDWLNINFDGEYSRPNYYINFKYFYLLDSNGSVEYNGNKYCLLTDLIIPEGITIIPQCAFYKCASLKSITIPNSVTSVGSWAFYRCDSLTILELPASVTSIGNYAFYKCENLTTLYYDGTIRDWLNINFDGEYSRPNYYINFKYFYLLDSNGSVEYNGNKYSLLTDLIIPEGITIIPQYAFYKCASLKSITIPNSVTSVGSWAFYRCDSLTTLYYDGKITDYLINCDSWSSNPNCNENFKYFYLLDSNGSVEYNGKKYSLLTDVVIPDGITIIPQYAFYNCASLTSIKIPKTVTSIESVALNNRPNSIAIYYDGTITDWLNIKFSNYNAYGELYILDSNGTVEYNGNKYSLLTDVVIPDGITSIPEHAFDYFTCITSVELPVSVVSIGSYAFRCDNLTTLYYDGTISDWLNITFDNRLSRPNENGSFKYFYILDDNGTVEYNGNRYSLLTDVVIPDGITSIPSYAFYNCTSLTNVTIPNSVTSIGNSAFYNCSTLISIILPVNLTSIDYYAFYGCKSLVEIINLSSLNITKGSTDNGYVGYYATSIIDAVSTDDYLFYSLDNNYYLVKYLGSDNQIILPNSFNEKSYGIFENAFKNNYNLTSISIPNNVTSIGENAFSACYGLTSITIPESITSIENNAFYECYSLVEVINKSSLNITKGSSDNGYVGYYALNIKTEGTSDIVNVNDYLFYSYDNINYLVKYIGNDTELTLPESYNQESYEIYKYTFYNCSNIKNINISNSITNIGDNALFGCDSLQYNEYDNGYYLGNTNNLYLVLIKCKSDKITSISIPDECRIILAKFNLYLKNISFSYNIVNATNTFNNCFNIENIYFNGTIQNWLNMSIFNYLNLPNHNSNFNNFYLLDSNGEIEYYSRQYSLLTEVVIPNEVVSIRNYAFAHFKCIRDVIIPDSVTSIEKGAFNYCTNLVNIAFSESLSNIEKNTFTECRNLKNIYFNGSIENLMNYGKAFYNSYLDINNVFLLDEDGDVEYRSNNYSLLTEVKIPDEVNTIPSYAFNNYKCITNIIIPEGVTKIESYAFRNCSNLSTISLPNSVISIGSNVFYGCTNLEYNEYENAYYLGNDNNPYMVLIKTKSKDITSCTINESCKIIYSGAFSDCNSLVEVINKSSINITKGSTDNGYVGYYAFNIKTEGTSDIVNVDDYLFYSYDNVNYLIKYIGTDSKLTLPESYNQESYEIYGYAFEDNKNVSSVVISNKVTNIGKNSFDGCSNLESVKLGNGVLTIGDAAFNDCISLISINIENNVTSIGDYAFYNCTSLTSITLPNNLNSIGLCTFYNCVNVTSLIIPNTMTSIADGAFENCYSLVEVINKSSLNITKGSSDNGYVGYYALNIKTEGITDIVNYNDYLFYEYNNVYYLIGYVGSDTNLILPDYIEINEEIYEYELYKYAFYSDEKISSITIANISTIPDYSFYNCTNLQTVTIGVWVESIGNYAFSNCTSLKEVNLGSFVSSVGNYAFNQCTRLYSISFTNSLSSIGSRAFNYCLSLTSITIPSSVKSIGSRAFQGCSSLVEVINKSSLNIIKGSTDYGCVGYYAFNIKTEGESDIVNINNYLFYSYDNVNYLVKYIGTETELTLPETYNGELYEIYGHSFNYNDVENKIVSLFIPNSVTSINNSSFRDCFKLEKVYYFGSKDEWDNIKNISNSSLSDKVYFYSDEKVSDLTYNYWHYVNDVITEW